jgi:hypothetical protein
MDTPPAALPTAPQTVLTAIVDNDFHYARTAEEIVDLVSLVVDVAHPDRASLLYLWDRPCRSGLHHHGGEGEYPGHQLRVVTDPASGWGAVNFVDTDDLSDASDSLNTEPGEAPELPFDPEGGSFFPASASIPLGLVRAAVAEFAVTGRRPGCLAWQPARLV